MVLQAMTAMQINFGHYAELNNLVERLATRPAPPVRLGRDGRADGHFALCNGPALAMPPEYFNKEIVCCGMLARCRRERR